MPLVSDPGYLLVRACVAAGLPVEVLPGPSAAITALVASGLPADEWHFHGFLPRKKGELREVLARAGAGTLRGVRVAAPAAGDAGAAGRDRPGPRGGGCRELTKAHEEIVRGTAAELAARYADGPPKGEIVLVIGPRGRAAAPTRRTRPRVDAAPQARRCRRSSPEGGRHRRLADGHKRKRAVPGAHFRVTDAHRTASRAARLARSAAPTFLRSADAPTRRPHRLVRALLSCAARPRPRPRGRMGLAGSRGGDHPLPQRRRPVCDGPAPRHRHRGARGHAGGGGRGRRGPLRGNRRLVGHHDRHPDRRRLRHLLPPPLVARR